MRLDEDGNLVPDPLYSVPHPGVVADREDPEKLGRVRLLVPGIYTREAPSPWAWPFGTMGGGSAQRGGFFVPEKGADVVVFFMLGNPERPFYICSNWGKPGGTSEAPTPVSSASVSDAPNVRVIETKNHLLWFDDRSGSEKIVIRNKSNGQKVMLGADAATQPFVKGTDWQTCMEAILDLIIAHVHPTAVGPSGPPSTAANFTTEKGLLSNKLSDTVFGK